MGQRIGPDEGAGRSAALEGGDKGKGKDEGKGKARAPAPAPCPGEVGFSTLGGGGGGFDRAPQNCGGRGVWEKGSIDRTINQLF